MKTIKKLLPIFTTLFLMPVLLKAQWQGVRWDKTNTFEKACTVSSNTAFVIGLEPINYEYFIVRTNDGGTTWDSIAVNSQNNSFQLTDLFFLDKDNGFIGGTKNAKQVLLKTTNNGNAWTEITPNAASSFPIISISFIDTQNGFATDGTTLYKTTNGGTAWTFSTPSFSVNDLSFFDMNNGFACGSVPAFGGSAALVMKTSDGGQTWNPLLNIYPLNTNFSFSKMDFINPTTGFTSLENKLYRTQDGGNSWDTIVAPHTIWDFDFTTNADTGHILTRHGNGWVDSSDLCITVDAGQNWKLEYSTGLNMYGIGVALNSFSFVANTGFCAGTDGLIKKYTFNATAIKEEKSNGTINTYPNPSNGKFTLEINDPQPVADKMNVEIYNGLGEKIYSKWMPSVQSEIDISNQPNGVCFLQVSLPSGNIKTEKKTIVKKIIIQK